MKVPAKRVHVPLFHDLHLLPCDQVRLNEWCALSASVFVYSHLLFFQDYLIFSSPHFDPNEYANAILAGDTYPPVPLDRTGHKPPSSAPEASAKEEISIAISKLTFGIDDVSKQIKTLVIPFHHHCTSRTQCSFPGIIAP
jgi:hypothetical protein